MPFVLLFGNFLSHFCRLKILSTLGGWLDEIVIGSVIVISIESCWKILQQVPGVDVMDPPTQYSQRYLHSKFLQTNFISNFSPQTTYIFIRWASTWIGWQNSLAWSTFLIDWLALIVCLPWQSRHLSAYLEKATMKLTEQKLVHHKLWISYHLV